MNHSQTARFKDAPWFPKNGETCMVGGAGGIGSWLCYFLSKIGFSIVLYDFDRVEEHNLGGQLFFQDSLGTYKTDAVRKVLDHFCKSPISTLTDKIDLNTATHWYAFSAFDNMKARKDLFEVWKKSWISYPEGVIPIFIDGRLEIEQLQVFCVTPENAKRYEEEFLFSDSVVEEAPCTMKQSSHTAAMIGSIMTAYFTNHIANLYAKETIREVPFYYEFVVPMNYSNSEL
jgi:molybdopterin/thiamine biosynthesis adenylyltransferase